MRALQSYTHTQINMHGYLSPISLDKLCSLVPSPELYNSLYQPQPMVPPSVDNLHKEQLLEDDDDDKMMPATTPGRSAAGSPYEELCRHFNGPGEQN